MSKEKKDEVTFWEKAQETFKVVILDEETFQEVKSYRLSRMHVYVMLSVLFLVLTGDSDLSLESYLVLFFKDTESILSLSVRSAIPDIQPLISIDFIYG